MHKLHTSVLVYYCAVSNSFRVVFKVENYSMTAFCILEVEEKNSGYRKR